MTFDSRLFLVIVLFLSFPGFVCAQEDKNERHPEIDLTEEGNKGVEVDKGTRFFVNYGTVEGEERLMLSVAPIPCDQVRGEVVKSSDIGWGGGGMGETILFDTDAEENISGVHFGKFKGSFPCDPEGGEGEDNGSIDAGAFGASTRWRGLAGTECSCEKAIATISTLKKEISGSEEETVRNELRNQVNELSKKSYEVRIEAQTKLRKILNTISRLNSLKLLCRIVSKGADSSTGENMSCSDYRETFINKIPEKTGLPNAKKFLNKKIKTVQSPDARKGIERLSRTVKFLRDQDFTPFGRICPFSVPAIRKKMRFQEPSSDRKNDVNALFECLGTSITTSRDSK